jgi:anaerobic C4-dicarboxylate transporter
VFVGVMALVVGVLVAMNGGLVAVLLAIMAMGLSPVDVFVLMLVFAVATHAVSPPGGNILINIVTRFRLRGNPSVIKELEISLRKELDIFFLLP